MLKRKEVYNCCYETKWVLSTPNEQGVPILWLAKDASHIYMVLRKITDYGYQRA